MHGTAARAVRPAALLVVLALLPVPASAGSTGTHRTVAAAHAAVGVPTATIGTFDCARRHVELTLDNSRSSDAVTYGYGASFRSPLRRPYSGVVETTQVGVAPGETRVVVLPVRDDARTDVTVELPDGGHVRSQGTCGNAPGATFARTDCDTLRLGLALVNSAASTTTRFRWVLADAAGPVRSETVDVDAGDVVDVGVPLLRGSRAAVEVTVDGKGQVATHDPSTCGRFVLDPRASFGAVDCGDVSAALVLDNSRSTSRVRVRLPGPSDVVLGAGEARSLRLHLPVAPRLAVTADEVAADGAPVDLAVVSTARCAEGPTEPTADPGPSGGGSAGGGSIGTVPSRSVVAGDDLAATGVAPRDIGGRAAAALALGLLVVAVIWWRLRRRRASAPL